MNIREKFSKVKDKLKTVKEKHGKRILAITVLFLVCGSSFLVYSWYFPLPFVEEHPWAMKQAKLMTPWADDVDPKNPLPEYPRPQLMREEWLSLNGIWKIQNSPTLLNRYIPYKSGWNEILVPFPVESAISGIMDNYTWMWYERIFTIPASWENNRIILHFEAVDWQTEVWVDGVYIGTHQGGYDPFSFEITSQITTKFQSNHTLRLRVYDPTDKGHQPTGKQVVKPEGTFYTSCTGIWQSVWLEPIDKIAIDEIKMIPDIDTQQLNLTVLFTNTTSLPSDLILQATINENGTLKSNFSFAIDQQSENMLLSVSNPILWDGSSPFLYNLTLKLVSAGKNLDTLKSYFGMRKIETAIINGTVRMMLNNKPLYVCGPLDQGYWPDGVYTAPTDDALAWDLIQIKNYGFNMTRKHVKIESRRWYYHCDRLGLLVFQDMPNGDYRGSDGPVNYQRELQELMKDHFNSPCIIEYTLFNEGWGQHDTAKYTQWAEAYDPSRLISSASGWTDYNMSDIVDWHNYPNPIMPSAQTSGRVQLLGEYGGIGFLIPDHLWTNNTWSYMMAVNETDYIEKFTELSQRVNILQHLWNLSGVVYTQITDVMQETNGLITYDRKVLKAPYAPIKEANRLWSDSKQFYSKEILPVSGYHKTNWSYTFTDPGSTSNWNKTTYDASSWSVGAGGFGSYGTPCTYINTEWKTWDIWMRKTFTLSAEDISDLNSLYFFMNHDDGVEVYINGVLAATEIGYYPTYILVNMTTASKNTLSSIEPNTIAVHCKQEWGGQYIDLGIIQWKEL